MTANTTEQVQSLRTTDIIPGANDRTVFDARKLDELAASIREFGLIQPISVRPVLLCSCGFVTAETLDRCPDCDSDALEPKYQITAGERRYRATILAGLDRINAIVRTLDDEQQSIMMLAENVARADLDPIDEALAYQSRIDAFGWTTQECADRAGVSAIRVRFRCKLLTLRQDLQKLVRDGQLDLGYAQILSDGALDANRQLIALSALRDCSSPTPAWFRRVVGELVEQQDQESLFDLDALTVQTVELETVTAATVEPPTPGTVTPPTTASEPRAILAEHVAFWTQAAADWDRLGKSFKRQQCQAAADALRTALSALGQ